MTPAPHRRSDSAILILLALASVLLHAFFNNRYGVLRGITWSVLAAGGAMSVVALLPIAPVNSPWWNRGTSQFEDFREEIGWPELVRTLASVRNTLPPEDRAHAAILAGNYGEAGAVHLYGSAFGLPAAISGVNSFWLRGYGEPPPQTVIAVGFSRAFLERNFESCELVRQREIPYGVKNEESTDHRDIFVCRRLRQPWPDFWRRFRSYG